MSRVGERHRKPRIPTPASRRERPGTGVIMTGNPPDEGTPAPQTPDYGKVIEELKAANVALAQKVVALEEKSKGYDAKISALSAPAPAADEKEAKLAAAKSELDKAYEKALADLGIKKE